MALTIIPLHTKTSYQTMRQMSAFLTVAYDRGFHQNPQQIHHKDATTRTVKYCMFSINLKRGWEQHSPPAALTARRT